MNRRVKDLREERVQTPPGTARANEQITQKICQLNVQLKKQ